ncbi:uncharacterized protein LOC128189467 isoform X1 [Crassostrea angulata]|uniref:uncharacterized protein LOC128189467 isoform X1 n=1 Tax=Magallana angulata TaxID=2784310 RepID=UPI0022B217AA|nr:uncharacterized protein LOC128189467 isoform X1 [Crassostrea angulata]
MGVTMNLWIWISFSFFISYANVVFARDVFESSEELVGRGVTESSLNTWVAPKYAENVGECAKLCHLEPDCLSFTINLDLNQCTGHILILDKHDPNLEDVIGAQYFYKPRPPVTTTPITTKRSKGWKGR